MSTVRCDALLPVPIAHAYDAWTIGWGLWFAAADSVRVTPRVGEPFCFHVEVPPDAVRSADTPVRHAHYGRFLELEAPSRVMFTWVTGPGGTGGAETVVTIDLATDDAQHTRCRLTHSGFATDEAWRRHDAAWPMILAAQATKLRAISAERWGALRAAHGVATPNRSLPDATFIPTRSYPDLDAAVSWLAAVLGCSERLRIPGHRVQLTLGNGAVVAAAWNPEVAPASGGRPPATLMVRVPDVDAAFARALAHGATAVTSPETHVYGERQATVRDPAGHAWLLTQTVADVDPATWGGVLLR